MNKSFRNRVGGVMRRMSSVSAISRPTTPGGTPGSDTETGSQKRRSSETDRAIDTHTTPPAGVSTPSPIAESPAREAAALVPDTAPLGPSPLSEAIRPGTPSIAPSEAHGASKPESSDAHGQTATGAQLTDEPHDISEPAKPPQQAEPSNETKPNEETKPQVSKEVPPPPKVADKEDYVPPSHPHSPSTEEPDLPMPAPEPQVRSSAPKPPSLAANDQAPSYFDQTANRVESPTPTVPFQRTLSENPWGPELFADQSREEPMAYKHSEESMDAGGDHHDRSVKHKQSGSSLGEVLTHQNRTIAYHPSNQSLRGLSHGPESRVIQLSRKPSKASIASSRGYSKVDRSHYVPPSVGHSMEGTHYGQSKPASIRMPPDNNDPFADPQTHNAPGDQISRETSKAPSIPPERALYDQQSPVDTRNQMMPMMMPLPSINDLMTAQPQAAGYSVDVQPRDAPLTNDLPHNGVMPQPREEPHPRGMPKPLTDETVPLLGHTSSGRSYVQPSTSTHAPPTVSPQNGNGTTWPAHAPHLHNLGWIEYNLPDASTYYVHPTLRVTTDIDLRNERKLEAVMVYFERKEVNTPQGWEMWLRDTSVARNGFVPMRCWVDHRKKTVLYDGPAAQSGPPNVMHVSEHDRLDLEYRYWCFIESHPAHTALPPNARSEAMDALTWSYTDRLLPSHFVSSSPFSQDECQELMTLLRSFNPQNDGGVQSVVHTRIVSRILLRVAHWHQANFRPNKPLPQDAARNGLRRQRTPFRRTLVDFVVSCVLLGVPLAFANRQNHHRDQGGSVRGTGPTLLIGACSCLVAAIVLSASVTFLSLPGLESVARIAGFVAILCTTASMASAVVVMLRCKAEMDGSTPFLVAREGMILISRRSVLMSLPIVYLAYGIIAFVVGVVLYTVKGISVQNLGVVKLQFDDYRRWTVVGSMGGVAGVLVTLAVLG